MMVKFGNEERVVAVQIAKEGLSLKNLVTFTPNCRLLSFA